MPKWTTYAKRISELPVDGYFDVPGYSKAASEIRKMRSGISMCRAAYLVRFKIRSLPSGGVRIIRTGDWNSVTLGVEYFETPTVHPYLIGTRSVPSWRRPPILWLGYSYNPSKRPKGFSRCKQRGCPFPHIVGSTMCRHHVRFFAYKESLMGEHLDKTELWNPREPSAPWALYTDWQPVSIERLELSLKYEVGWSTKFDNRHKSSGLDESTTPQEEK